ncbi:F-box/LRR-repeat protein 14-like [Trifolium pratense]|uniref:F-box/LRR-repeat protein 14-like n=1 Tax=Trifolium pratense TaxID=57577 RepID=UPI001E694FC2|nr:F-box/LRR-repeat protein 14-like [Trifolium pratense]
MVEVEQDFYLPDDCWEHVLKFLNDDDKENRRYLKSVSVVSKRFLSITNRLRSSLTICKQLSPFLTAIFHRFPNLTSIKFLRLCGDRNAILSQISCFPFNITSLKLISPLFIPVNELRAFSQKITSLTSLECSHMNSISVTDLSLIVDCFPLLEELHLTSSAIFYGNMLNGIETLSLALSKLRKINLSNHTYMNDQSVFHLFNNCKLLEEVIIFGCYGITNAGIASALPVRPTLRSLSLTNYVDNWTTLLAIVRSCPSISDIKMEYPEFRKKTVDNSYSLKNFVVSPQLKSLCLARNTWLKDESILMFASSFPNLQLLDLSYCNQISESICQVLMTSSKIRHLNLQHCSKVKLRGLNFELPKLEVLNLSHTEVDNESIITFASSFPNLQILDLSYCNQICEGICQLLRYCSKIRHLNLHSCFKVKLHGLNCEVPKLEVLNLSNTRIDNEELSVISKSFRGLLELSLEVCSFVTKRGVNHVVENCTQLREINLRGCYKVHKNIVASMISSRPSLKKIVVPPRYRFNNNKREHFIGHICLLR